MLLLVLLQRVSLLACSVFVRVGDTTVICLGGTALEQLLLVLRVLPIQILVGLEVCGKQLLFAARRVQFTLGIILVFLQLSLVYPTVLDN